MINNQAARYNKLISILLIADEKDVNSLLWKAQPAITKTEAQGIIQISVAKKNGINLILKNHDA